MAYATGSLTAQQIADAASTNPHKPLLCFETSAELIGSDIQWRPNGDNTGAADTDSSYPEARAVDRRAVSRTRPATGAATHYLVLGNAGTMQNIEIDLVAIVGHNLGTLGATVEVQIADNKPFTVNLLTIASFTPADNARLIDLTLGGGNNVYSALNNVRLKFTNLGGGKPEIGELILGKRRQMPHGAQNPWDTSDRGGSDFEVFGSPGGDRVPYLRSGGRWRQPMDMRFNSDANAEILRAAWRDSNYGGRAGILIPRPTVPSEYYLVTCPGGLSAPARRNPDHRRYLLDLDESAPTYESEQ